MDNWENINAVQRVQDYISENINKPITLYMLSRAAGYSPWHTSRIFKLAPMGERGYIEARPVRAL